MSDISVYDNPLVTRYASREMAELWGPQRKFSTWRRLWLALAEAEHELGLCADDGVTPRITSGQLGALRQCLDNIDFDRAAHHERRLRHDVMAHIHTLGEACPAARDILHLGATSCYVTDNTDLILMREGLTLLRDRLVELIEVFGEFARRWRDTATLGFTHFQPAQLTTVTGQTYPRKVDSQVLDTLSGLAQSAHKYGTDLRLLAHRQEIDEPFEAEQVGSSAMAYKRNPMRAERMCGLARFVVSLAANTAQTAMTQWLERTLDDSVNRRLALPQAFLGADAILRLALNITRGLVVQPDVIRRNVEQVLPYMATENILMAAVAHGGDRQSLHERIRQHSMAVTAQLKTTGGKNDLIERLQADPAFASVGFAHVLQSRAFVGRAPEQVDEFLSQEVEPMRKRYPKRTGLHDEDLNV